MSTENKKPRNPNAFPTPMETGYEYNEDGQTIGNQEGMTLRDYFANSAMQGYLASHAHPEAINPLNGRYDDMVKEVYSIADAMLKQREP